MTHDPIEYIAPLMADGDPGSSPPPPKPPTKPTKNV